MKTPDTYLRKAEAAERAAETVTDETAKRILNAAAQRWRQVADIAQRNSSKESDQIRPGNYSPP
jgi:hypothetical protein